MPFILGLYISLTALTNVNNV